ncbi:MAG: SRPBCC family protein [Geodermatophilaceae bacterium]
MGDYQQAQDIDAPAQQLFDYLADVRNLPKYFDSMTSAEPAAGEAVHVVADVHGTKREGEAWFRVDRDAQHLEWGSEGDSDYRGSLDVSGDGPKSTVTVSLHTERVDSGELDAGLASTLANIKTLIEAGPEPESP